jgi:hypothetical protein
MVLNGFTQILQKIFSQMAQLTSPGKSEWLGQKRLFCLGVIFFSFLKRSTISG